MNIFKIIILIMLMFVSHAIVFADDYRGTMCGWKCPGDNYSDMETMTDCRVQEVWVCNDATDTTVVYGNAVCSSPDWSYTCPCPWTPSYPNGRCVCNGGGCCSPDGRYVSNFGPETCVCTYISGWKNSSWSECELGEQYLQNGEPITSTDGSRDCSDKNQSGVRSCGICGDAANLPSGEMPSENLCNYGILDDNPIINGKNWEWSCLGGDGTTDVDDVLCSVPNEEDGQCSAIYQDQIIESPGLNGAEDLCTGGTVNDFNAVTSDGPWTWNCLRTGTNPDHSDKECSAKCFDVTVNVNPNPFKWPVDGSASEIKISITPYGMCQGKYSCDVDGQSIIFGTGEVTKNIDQTNPDLDIPVNCIVNNPVTCPVPLEESCPDITKEDSTSITGYCIVKNCNVQGSCQAISMSAVSANDTICSSTCNSNADCSSSRIIETRP